VEEVQMNTKPKQPNLDFLCEVILNLKDKEECKAFLEDLCTVPELKALSQRLEVADLLYRQTVYSAIVEKTGASTATISRVNRSLSYGNEGYKVIFERLKK